MSFLRWSRLTDLRYNHLRCQRFPHMLDGYQSLTSEELIQALLKNERRRQGCIPWQPRSDSVAQRVLKSVEICARSVWGSNAEHSFWEFCTLRNVNAQYGQFTRACTLHWAFIRFDLLRSALLKLRPNYWPLWERPLTSAEIDEQAASEVVCRDTKRQAVNIINERETLHTSFSGTDMAIKCGGETADLLHQANSTQMKYDTNDHDPYRNDHLTRLFEVLHRRHLMLV
ncbi:hypothetical protein GQ600_1327 [Phytophthora cactorum]|nr:hypothetical protein GQ600_1327 [Phytophthora cactorum]